jgi:hypothetical protein
MKDIEPIHESEVPVMGNCCDIRFDCLVTMYDSGSRVRKVDAGLFLSTEKALPPQWFKNEMTLSLEAVKHSDPYELGTRLKIMFQQLDDHIKHYEKG